MSVTELELSVTEGVHPDQEYGTWLMAGHLDAAEIVQSFAFLRIFN